MLARYLPALVFMTHGDSASVAADAGNLGCRDVQKVHAAAACLTTFGGAAVSLRVRLTGSVAPAVAFASNHCAPQICWVHVRSVCLRS